MSRTLLLLLAVLSAGGCNDSNAPGSGRSGEILFQSNRRGNFEIYAITPDGSAQRRLTNSSDNEIHAAWSPDGRQVVYVSDREPSGLYIMKADGSAPRPLQTEPMNAEYPAWAPDGRRIAFQSDRGGDAEIWIINPDGTGLRQITPTGTVAKAPAWSPDGSRIAFQLGVRQLAHTDPEGTGLSVIGSTPDNAWDDSPAWSPDGGSIAFVRFAFPATGAHQSIWVMNSNGSGAQRLTRWTAGIDFTPAWSPDGSQIAFAHDVNDNFDIYVMSRDGSEQRNLTNEPGINFRPSW